jgi:hypothetical protein
MTPKPALIFALSPLACKTAASCGTLPYPWPSSNNLLRPWHIDSAKATAEQPTAADGVPLSKPGPLPPHHQYRTHSGMPPGRSKKQTTHASSSATTPGRRWAISISRMSPADDQRPSCAHQGRSSADGGELRQAARAAPAAAETLMGCSASGGLTYRCRVHRGFI